MKNLWALFCQAVTIVLASIFIFAVFKPSWLANIGGYQIISSAPISKELYDGKSNPGSFHLAVDRAMPAVVNIYTNTKSSKAGSKKDVEKNSLYNYFFDEDSKNLPSSNLGSGVIANSNGVILTNHHVIKDSDDIEVALADGRKLKASLIGSDPDTDLAVLKIDAPNLPEPIHFAQIDSVHVGDIALAIGNPFGVGQTVTSGIVSGLGRDHLGINTYENFIQTDAAINPGNSGGALIDTNGHLIGINTAIFSNSGGSMGIGFAIPVNLAMQVMESILKSGQVTRGWIGIEPKEDTQGVLVSGVLEGGPADRSGIKPGDVLISINGKSVNDVRQLLNQIAQLEPGSQANFYINRKGRDQELKVLIGKRPKAKKTE